LEKRPNSTQALLRPHKGTNKKSIRQKSGWARPGLEIKRQPFLRKKIKGLDGSVITIKKKEVQKNGEGDNDHLLLYQGKKKVVYGNVNPIGKRKLDMGFRIGEKWKEHELNNSITKGLQKEKCKERRGGGIRV